jgi:alpha,alpha-trehalase
MKKRCIFLICYVYLCLPIMAQAPQTPDKIYGELFHAVQMNRVFADGKTFVDCIPLRSPQAIMEDYHRLKRSDSITPHTTTQLCYAGKRCGNAHQKSLGRITP